MWVFRKLLKLRLDLIEALFCLVVARMLLLMPFRWIAPWIGRPAPGEVRNTTQYRQRQSEAALAVRRAILSVADGLPWSSSCLVRGIAARMMTGRRGLPSVLQLGVGAGENTGLSAHAWFRCGDVDVVGTETADAFHPIVAFVREPKRLLSGAAKGRLGGVGQGCMKQAVPGANFEEGDDYGSRGDVDGNAPSALDARGEVPDPQ